MNVLSTDFSIKFVSQFNFVFSAVDNISARSKVSQLCVLLRILFIDVGSSGRIAQSIPIIPFHSSCFNCSPPAQNFKDKVTCTIRSTPTTYEHCAAWAFHLFDAIFHSGENAIVSVKDCSLDNIFDLVFNKRIADLREKEDLWKGRRRPEPIISSEIASDGPIQRLTEVWTDEESVQSFLFCLRKIQKLEEYDKDNIYHSSFITAAANIQAKAFKIEERKSVFDCKAIVSEIEPALATTNSIISSVSVCQMIKMINKLDLKSIWLTHGSNGPKLSPTRLEKINANCAVCTSEIWEIKCNFASTCFSALLKLIEVENGSIVFDDRIVYDFDNENDRLLSESSLIDGSLLIVDSLNDSKMRYILLSSE